MTVRLDQFQCSTWHDCLVIVGTLVVVVYYLLQLLGYLKSFCIHTPRSGQEGGFFQQSFSAVKSPFLILFQYGLSESRRS